MSSYDRVTGVKRLRVRGLKAVRFCAILKALGVNILRAAAFRGEGIGQNEAVDAALYVVSRFALALCRAFSRAFRYIHPMVTHDAANNEYGLYMVA